MIVIDNILFVAHRQLDYGAISSLFYTKKVRNYEKEAREMQQLNRKQAQITGAAQQEMASRQSKAQIIGSGIGAVGNIASAGIGKM